MKGIGAVLVAALVAQACAYDATRVPVGVQASEVQAMMGRPTEVLNEADGGATWEYARGPEGLHTYMVRLGPDQRVREVRQVLTPEVFARIQPGKTTRDEVRRLLGKPARESTIPLKNEVTWDYRYLQEGYPWLFYVGFDPSGVVAETGSLIDDPRLRQSGGAEGR